ncbi:VOC family protein [Glaciimonas sp. PCH181]|uniref:VOC family protein n=1 Tax=Glaciimonas sp. PCH181 TaxID=2133943 RepID=UPI000D3369D4|nr:VOC family protein [Glaciimonas sp. PCH181]PUA20426.1 glyoxalase [Glaciimonas sp. PCH181]
MIKSLAYLGINSPHYKEWEIFGPEVLGLQHAGYGPDGAVHLRLDEAAHRIAIHPGERDAIAYIGWSVKDEASAKTITDRITAYGLEVTRSRTQESAQRKVEGFYWFHDPSGFRHELSWGQYHTVAPFHPGRALKGFRTAEQGLGHIVLAVADLDEGDRFYREVLGFHQSDIVRDGPLEAHFYHINGRHHSLAITSLPTRDVAFLHLMIEANSLDDVGTAHDMCEQRGIPITTTLGRHSNDQMISFYMYTPSGFRLEYGWGGLDVDHDLWVPRTYDKPSSWGHRRQHQELTALKMVDTPSS